MIVWMFALFFAFVLLGVVILSAWIGPSPNQWEPRPEDRLVTEEWLSGQQTENAAWQRPTDGAGLAHIDDLRP